MHREEYQRDSQIANSSHILLTMDLSQNLALPSAGDTPSSWYFSSLISVSVFGIHDTQSRVQTNYVYTERKGGKGSNEVISMLSMFLAPIHGKDKTLTIYADNCAGQNKNNFVIKFVVMLTHVGWFREVNLKFFLKGHTKNACDRGFAYIRKRYEKRDCWTYQHVVETVRDAAISSRCEALENFNAPFSNYKDVMLELYKNVVGVQKYQLFRSSRDEPGVIECRRSPDAPPDRLDLRNSYDGIQVTPEQCLQLFEYAESVPPPPLNAEKLLHIRQNIFPFVPSEYADDELYRLLTSEEEKSARAIKKVRLAAMESKKNSKEKESKSKPASKRPAQAAAATKKPVSTISIGAATALDDRDGSESRPREVPPSKKPRSAPPNRSDSNEDEEIE